VSKAFLPKRVLCLAPIFAQQKIKPNNYP